MIQTKRSTGTYSKVAGVHRLAFTERTAGLPKLVAGLWHPVVVVLPIIVPPCGGQ
jgi:hypothetical protein